MKRYKLLKPIRTINDNSITLELYKEKLSQHNTFFGNFNCTNIRCSQCVFRFEEEDGCKLNLIVESGIIPYSTLVNIKTPIITSDIFTNLLFDYMRTYNVNTAPLRYSKATMNFMIINSMKIYRYVTKPNLKLKCS